jgi:hypothetical protein
MKLAQIEIFLVDKNWDYQYKIGEDSISYYINRNIRFSGTGDLLVNGSIAGTWTFEKNDRKKVKGVVLHTQAQTITSRFYWWVLKILFFQLFQA